MQFRLNPLVQFIVITNNSLPLQLCPPTPITNNPPPPTTMTPITRPPLLQPYRRAPLRLHDPLTRHAGHPTPMRTLYRGGHVQGWSRDINAGLPLAGLAAGVVGAVVALFPRPSTLRNWLFTPPSPGGATLVCSVYA